MDDGDRSRGAEGADISADSPEFPGCTTGGVRRGRGRPHKPSVPVPPWPLITGELELPKNAFKRAGEVIRADYGREPVRPATFVYGR